MNTQTKHLGLRSLVLIVVIAALLFAGFRITGAAAQAAIPGDALYPVKTSIEQTRLSLAQDAGDRAQMRMGFAEQRLEEIAALIKEGRYREVDAAILAFEADIHGAILELETISQIDPARGGQIALEITKALTLYAQTLSAMAASAPQSVRTEVSRALDTTQIASGLDMAPAVLGGDDHGKDNTNDNGNDNGVDDNSNSNGDDTANSNGVDDNANSNGDDDNTNNNGDDNSNNSNGNGDDDNSNANAENANSSGDDNSANGNGNGADDNSNDTASNANDDDNANSNSGDYNVNSDGTGGDDNSNASNGNGDDDPNANSNSNDDSGDGNGGGSTDDNDNSSGGDDYGGNSNDQGNGGDY